MPRDDLPFAAGMAESADATDETQGARSNALIIISPAAPYETAKQFTLTWHSALDGALRLRRHREVFYSWTSTYYAEVSRERIDAEIYEFLSRCFMVGPERELIPVRPNIGLVANVLKALKAWTFTVDDKSAPAWLGRRPDAAESSDILACANGLLHLPTRALMPHTPEFFCLNALPFGYDADAPPPIAWLKFLCSLWPDDQQSIDALQDYFGLCLSSETRYQRPWPSSARLGPERARSRGYSQRSSANPIPAR
jgi:putative DNA primase/helicase